jgi:hypothetical protein
MAMRILIANDEGRLSNRPELKGLCESLGIASANDLDRLIRLTSDRREPVVLLWHQSPHEVLDEVARMFDAAPNLCGLIFFRASKFAGYFTQEEADRAIQAAGLSGRPVHIFPSPVDAEPTGDVVNRIRIFMAEQRKRQRRDLPVFHLLREKINKGDAAWRLLLLSDGLRQRPDLVAELYFMASARKVSLVGEQADKEWIRIADEAEAFRAKNPGLARIECFDCTVLKHHHHIAATALRMRKDEPGLREIALESAKAMLQHFETPYNGAKDAARDLCAPIAALVDDDFIEKLEGLIRNHVSTKCPFNDREALGRTIAGVRDGMSAKSGTEAVEAIIELPSCRYRNGGIDL